MTLSPPGTRLGPYELVAPVGAGGMGLTISDFGPRFEPGVPLALFSKPEMQSFDVEPDGGHFVLVDAPEPTTRTSLGVVVNWFSRISPKIAQAPSR